MRNKRDTLAIVALLKSAYPSVDTGNLNFEDAWQLLVAVRLAAQCTDARVNKVTPVLYTKYPSLAALAAANPADIEAIVKPCGLGHSKARDIHAAAGKVLQEFGGILPNDMAALLSIPGVGRKSANLILGDVYHVPGVVIADTHCIRLANRLGFIKSKDPAKVETALRKVLPPLESNDFCHRCVLHGRAVCTARSAYCGTCVLRDSCPKIDVTPAALPENS